MRIVPLGKTSRIHLYFGTKRGLSAPISNYANYLKARKLVSRNGHSELPYHSRIHSRPLLSLGAGDAPNAPELGGAVANERAGQSNSLGTQVSNGSKSRPLARGDALRGTSRASRLPVARGRF